LLDVRDDRLQGDQIPFGMKIAQRASRGVVHHDIGNLALNTEIEAADNVRVFQVRYGLRFLEKPLRLLIVSGQ
jgi:hypothetical protein